MRVLLVLSQMIIGLTVSQAAPQRPAGMYDDRTGITYNQAVIASMSNRDLSGVPRLEMIPGNETPMAERRMFKNKHQEHQGPSHVMGPWMKYSQTYWNPYIYGGPNGPPTFYPYLGVWPTYPQERPEFSNKQPPQYIQSAQGYDLQGPEALGKNPNMMSY
ncbi:unnamed protein product [Allacma fusca]|uniref:Secreted protein n=1 Tax=Allacma fusca TaxID=39272 RepID=A0A8J2NW26_9HEXA|nr:unnamed protein product [Allacma fusca]